MKEAPLNIYVRENSPYGSPHRLFVVHHYPCACHCIVHYLQELPEDSFVVMSSSTTHEHISHSNLNMSYNYYINVLLLYLIIITSITIIVYYSCKYK